MNKTFVKSKLVLSAICMSGMLLLCSCGAGGDISQPDTSGTSSSTNIVQEQPPTAVVTDVVLSDAEVHEVLLPQEFTDGEVIDNPYYKRTADENGTPVFAVKKATDGQTAYLPFSETTVYHTDEGPCYFERKVLTYKLDGVEKTTTQYDLWVADVLPETPEGSSLDAGAISAGIEGTEGAVGVDGDLAP